MSCQPCSNKNSDHPSSNNNRVHPHNSGTKFINDNRLPVVSRFEGYSIIKSKTSVSTNIFNGGQLDFVISPSIQSFVNKIVCHIRVTNTGVGAINFDPAFIWDRIQYLSSSGSVMYEVNSDAIYLHKVNYNRNYLEKVGFSEGLNTTTYNYGVSLGAGVSADYYIHMTPCPLTENSGILPCALKGDLTIRMYFQSICTDTIADLSVNDVELILDGEKYNSTTLALEKSKRMSENLKYRIITPVIASQKTLALAASTSYDFELTSSMGKSSKLVIFLRSGARAYSNNTVFYGNTQIDSVELYDQNSQRIANSVSPALNRMLFKSHLEGDLYDIKDAIQYIPFHIAQSEEQIIEGAYVGSYDLSGNERIRLNLGSTFAPGSYTVYIYSYQYETFEINNGVWDIKKGY